MKRVQSFTDLSDMTATIKEEKPRTAPGQELPKTKFTKETRGRWSSSQSNLRSTSDPMTDPLNPLSPLSPLNPIHHAAPDPTPAAPDPDRSYGHPHSDHHGGYTPSDHGHSSHHDSGGGGGYDSGGGGSDSGGSSGGGGGDW
jgi:hypothetical protein